MLSTKLKISDSGYSRKCQKNWKCYYSPTNAVVSYVYTRNTTCLMKSSMRLANEIDVWIGSYMLWILAFHGFTQIWSILETRSKRPYVRLVIVKYFLTEFYFHAFVCERMTFRCISRVSIFDFFSGSRMRDSFLAALLSVFRTLIQPITIHYNMESIKWSISI